MVNELSKKIPWKEGTCTEYRTQNASLIPKHCTLNQSECDIFSPSFEYGTEPITRRSFQSLITCEHNRWKDSVCCFLFTSGMRPSQFLIPVPVPYLHQGRVNPGILDMKDLFPLFLDPLWTLSPALSLPAEHIPSPFLISIHPCWFSCV